MNMSKGITGARHWVLQVNLPRSLLLGRCMHLPVAVLAANGSRSTPHTTFSGELPWTTRSTLPRRLSPLPQAATANDWNRNTKEQLLTLRWDHFCCVIHDPMLPMDQDKAGSQLDHIFAYLLTLSHHASHTFSPEYPLNKSREAEFLSWTLLLKNTT